MLQTGNFNVQNIDSVQTLIGRRAGEREVWVCVGVWIGSKCRNTCGENCQGSSVRIDISEMVVCLEFNSFGTMGVNSFVFVDKKEASISCGRVWGVPQSVSEGRGKNGATPLICSSRVS